MVAAIDVLKPRLTQQLFLPLALTTGIVTTLITHVNGGSLILLALALILLVTTKTSPHMVTYRILGAISLTAALVLGIYSIYADFSFSTLLLIVAFMLSGITVYLALRLRENPAQQKPTYGVILSILLAAALLALLSTFDHWSISGRSLAELSASTVFFIVLYVLTTTMMSLAFQILIDVSYRTQRENREMIAGLFGAVLILSSVLFAIGFAASVRIIEPIALIITLIAGAFLVRNMPLPVSTVSARILLGWIAALLAIENYRDSSSLILLIFFLVISLSSFFLYRYFAPRASELIIGMVSLWLALPTLLYVLDDHGIGWSDVGYWFLVLTVAGIWTLSRRKAVFPALGATLFAALFRVLVQLVIDRDYPRIPGEGSPVWDSLPVHLLFGTLVIAAIALIIATVIPDFDSQSSKTQSARLTDSGPDTNTAVGLLDRWDPRRNRLLTTTVLIPTSLTVVITQYYSLFSQPAALGILLLFVLWGLVSRPHIRTGLWVAGFGFALIRFYGGFPHGYSTSLLTILLETVSVLFMAISAGQIYRDQKTQTPYEQIYSWIAWGFLALATVSYRAEADDLVSFSPQLLLILLSLGVLFLAVFQRAKVLGVFTAALITYHIVRILSGANPLTLLLLGVGLIGFVIFRLLTRASDPEEDSQPTLFVRADEHTGQPPHETVQQGSTTQQPAPADSTKSAPAPDNDAPWDLPRGQQTLPWKDPNQN